MHEVCHVIFDAAILFAGKPCSRADVERKFTKLFTNVYHQRAIDTINSYFDGAYHLVAGLAAPGPGPATAGRHRGAPSQPPPPAADASAREHPLRAHSRMLATPLRCAPARCNFAAPFPHAKGRSIKLWPSSSRAR